MSRLHKHAENIVMAKFLRVGIVLSILLISSTTFAYWPYGYFGYGYFGGTDYSQYAPYYAVNPPVYYTNVVGRSYGWSPVPYIDTGYSSYGNSEQPPIIINTYASQGTPSAAYTEQARLPLRISNPFVEQANGGESKK
jgi:hypothetical protein